MLKVTHRAALTAALFAAVAPIARAEEFEAVAASRIDAVTVYEDRALVTRGATLTLVKGVTRVSIENLPAGLDATSLRARATGAQVLGVEVEAVHLEKENSEALRTARGARRKASSVHRDAEIQLDEATASWDTLTSIRAVTAKQASEALGGAGLDTERIGQMLDFIAERSAAARRLVIEGEERVAQAKEAVDAAARRVAELAGAGAREERRAIVTLRAASDDDTGLELSYLIAGASWRPVYALRVDADFGGALLELGAEVQQATGEDWTGVNLELTTARPSAGAAPPEPVAWRVHPERPDNEGMSAGRARRAVAMKAEAREYADAAPTLEVRVARSGLVVAFAAHRKESVASGARPARISLGQFDLDPEIVWSVFPRANTDVFVTAQVTNTTKTPLPAGEARVFVGPDYVGPLTLADWGIDQEIRVGLGVDRQVEAERTEVARNRETEGLFSKDTVHTRRYRITVKNHRTRSIKTRIVDQIPVSSDEDIVVKLTESSRKQATLPARKQETNAATGVLEWHAAVAAGASLDVYFAFEVRYPKALRVSGLE